MPPGARLVLLGDPDQLPSVEAGDVLAAILTAAGNGETPAIPPPLAPLLGGPGAVAGDAGAGLAGHHVRLLRGYRQAATLDLSPLAAAVREGDADATLGLLRSGQLAGVHFHEDLFDPLAAQRDALLPHWRALAETDEPHAALEQAARVRLLTAVREGPQGARGLNARIEEALAGNRGPAYFHGRLLLVTQNNHRQRLFNGDIGICLRNAQGAVLAWFPGDPETGPRPFHPAALPAHESAFAMTVHKAQVPIRRRLVAAARGKHAGFARVFYTALTGAS